MLGRCCCVSFFSSCRVRASQRQLLLWSTRASVVAHMAWELQFLGSWAQAQYCGTPPELPPHGLWRLPRPGIQPGLLRRQVDSWPPSHQGSPQEWFLLDASPLSDMWFENIFSYSVSCLSTFLMVFLKVCNFSEFHVILFLLIPVLLVSYPRNHRLIQSHEHLPVCFLLGVL